MTSAAKTVQTYVSQLRRCLPERRIETLGAGYRLGVAADEIDLGRLEALVANAGQLRRDFPLDSQRPNRCP